MKLGEFLSLEMLEAEVLTEMIKQVQITKPLNKFLKKEPDILSSFFIGGLFT